MKFRLSVFRLLILPLILLSCQSEASEPPETALNPTPTWTFPIEVWAALPSATPTAMPAVTSAPVNATPTPTLPPPSETSAPTPPPATPTASVTTLLFTGAIVPGRCVQAAVDARGNADFLYNDVRDLLTEADLTIGILNASLSDYPPKTGCIKTFVLVGSSNNADAMANAGFDVMNVATNHIKNCGLSACGDIAFFDTLDNLNRVGIQPVGAGLNFAEAIQPVVKTINGVRFGFVAMGEIEPRSFAGEDTPGIAPLPENFSAADINLIAALDAARQVADVVIFMPHWGSDYSNTPNYRQLHFAQVAAEAGADLIIGGHPHVIQGMEEINGIPVFYSPGSFVFDQDWSKETQQGLVIRVTFNGSQLQTWEVIPVHIDPDGHVQEAESPEAEEILNRFNQLSAALQ